MLDLRICVRMFALRRIILFENVRLADLVDEFCLSKEPELPMLNAKRKSLSYGPFTKLCT